jgi:hypothetical protein
MKKVLRREKVFYPGPVPTLIQSIKRGENNNLKKKNIFITNRHQYSILSGLIIQIIFIRM